MTDKQWSKSGYNLWPSQHLTCEDENKITMKNAREITRELEEVLLTTTEMSAYGMVKLGKLYSSVNRFEEAVEAYNMAIELEPKELGFYFYRGVAKFHMGESQGAMKDFQVALEANPLNKVEILNFTGTIKFRQGDYTGAKNDINEVLNRNNGLLNDLVMRPDEYNQLVEKGIQ